VPDDETGCLGSVFDPEMLNINGVSGPAGASGRLAILLHFNGALIILFQIIFLDPLALGLHKHFHPEECVWEVIACSDDLSLGRAFVLSFCFLLNLQTRPPLPKGITPPV
jgi:hypothetical protein